MTFRCLHVESWIWISKWNLKKQLENLYHVVACCCIQKGCQWSESWKGKSEQIEFAFMQKLFTFYLFMWYWLHLIFIRIKPIKNWKASQNKWNCLQNKSSTIYFGINGMMQPLDIMQCKTCSSTISQVKTNRICMFATTCLLSTDEWKVAQCQKEI